MRSPIDRRPGLGARAITALLAVAVLALAGVGAAVAAVSHAGPFGTHRVGQQVAGATLLPDNEWVAPVGTRILDRKARLLSSTLSPGGTDLAALGWNDFDGYLTIVDVRSHKIIQQTPLASPNAKKPTDNTVGPDGPLYSADGRTLWVPQSGYLLRFSVDPATGRATQTAAIELCGEKNQAASDCEGNSEAQSAKGAELPAGMALSPDGSQLYVALNGANALAVIDTQTNQVTRQIPVGNAPRQVVLDDHGSVAYVTNEGGERAGKGQFTNLSDGTPIVASKVTGGAITGTVSVVDLATGRQEKQIHVGLQPTEMYMHDDALMVADSNDDRLSVIDTATNRVTQTVNTNPVPDVPKVGSYADAITMVGDHVLVAIGRDNALAEYAYHGLRTRMTYEGLIPTDWYPVGVQADPALGGRLVVTNDKGIGARGPESTIDKDYYTKVAKGHNTYDDTGSLTIFKLPSASGLKADTKRVFTDNAWTEIPVVDQGTDDTVPSVIPRKLGQSSPIKHVVVIVRENRTYDQILGDLGEGNGDPALAQFGRYVTPNYHALADRFGDLDNFYDEGTLSADGHNWIVQAEANDYNEREFGAFYRSYPAQGGDALAYQRDGFLWNAAERAHKTVEDFGEYANFPEAISTPWDKYWRDSQILQGKAKGKLPVPISANRTYADIPSLNKIMDHQYPKFQLDVPDQYRVDIWNKQFTKWEKTGKMPNLQLMWVMDDHTAGVGSGEPYPVAEAADNDLATGRVISEISHSRFWKSTAVFVVEDDTQNGADSVDGHRGPVIVASPYSKAGVDNRYYSQINMVRTIEQILGIKPMNQEDGSAAPMYAAFTAKPDDAPFQLRKNIVPLTLGAPGYAKTLTSGPLKGTGMVPKAMRSVYDAWVTWSRAQKAAGRDSRPDAMNPQQLNRLDWYSAHNWTTAYPGDARIYRPDQVPGRKLPAAFLGDG